MREIKFKGIDVFTGKWVFGDLVHNEKVTVTGLENRVMVGGYEVNPESVCEFTGLYDIDGNEIYEGDWLRAKPIIAKNGEVFKSRGNVYYEDGSFRCTIYLGTILCENSIKKNWFKVDGSFRKEFIAMKQDENND